MSAVAPMDFSINANMRGISTWKDFLRFLLLFFSACPTEAFYFVWQDRRISEMVKQIPVSLPPLHLFSVAGAFSRSFRYIFFYPFVSAAVFFLLLIFCIWSETIGVVKNWMIFGLQWSPSGNRDLWEWSHKIKEKFRLPYMRKRSAEATLTLKY